MFLPQWRERSAPAQSLSATQNLSLEFTISLRRCVSLVKSTFAIRLFQLAFHIILHNIGTHLIFTSLGGFNSRPSGGPLFLALSLFLLWTKCFAALVHFLLNSSFLVILPACQSIFRHCSRCVLSLQPSLQCSLIIISLSLFLGKVHI